jgi:hypothetical protein
MLLHNWTDSQIFSEIYRIRKTCARQCISSSKSTGRTEASEETIFYIHVSRCVRANPCRIETRRVSIAILSKFSMRSCTLTQPIQMSKYVNGKKAGNMYEYTSLRERNYWWNPIRVWFTDLTMNQHTRVVLFLSIPRRQIYRAVIGRKNES